MIKNFKPRLFQETIFATASKKNTLVVIPTGMGKTNIFLMLAAHRLKLYPNSKVLLLGPTRPLIDQYHRVFLEHFDFPPEKMAVFTGMVEPKKRHELWKSAQIIFSTPQGLENDVISGRITLEAVSLLGFDEAHRAVGDYAYAYIAKKYAETASYPRIIAMTASPGSDMERISEVVRNLYIEDMEIRTENSPDVSPFIQEVSIRHVMVDFPEEFKEVHKYLKDCFRSKIDEIKRYGYAHENGLYTENKRDILALQASLQGELAGGSKDFEVLRSISLAAEALKIQHAIELLETQGLLQTVTYLGGIEAQARTSKVKAVQNLAKDINFRSALVKARRLAEKDVLHPKIVRLQELVKSELKARPGMKAIIFTQYRETGQRIMEILENSKISAGLFVGQAKKGDTGLSQKKQIGMLEDFRQGRFRILVATSVGEEGLDIPEVDSVIFYEPIPSAIRSIQRRGRTGRLKEGSVTVLVTKGTRDEGYRWSAFHKEKRMYRKLEELKKGIRFQDSESRSRDRSLQSYGNAKDVAQNSKRPLVYADYREKGSPVIKSLLGLDTDLRLEALKVGDYIVSSRAAIEFKTVEDFVDSLVDGRLLSQARELKENFDRPLLMVEGERDIYSVRNIHPNAIRGLLAAIAVGYGIPIMYTKAPGDTAAMILAVAKREQEEKGRDFSAHGEKRVLGLKEQQEYLVSSLPGIGPGLARQLLSRFGSVKGMLGASREELQETPGIGKTKAEGIKRVYETAYG